MDLPMRTHPPARRTDHVATASSPRGAAALRGRISVRAARMRAGVAAAALLVAGGADAADLALPPAAAPAYDWSGFYVGGHAGFAAAGSEFTATQPGGAPGI